MKAYLSQAIRANVRLRLGRYVLSIVALSAVLSAVGCLTVVLTNIRADYDHAQLVAVAAPVFFAGILMLTLIQLAATAPVLVMLRLLRMRGWLATLIGGLGFTFLGILGLQLLPDFHGPHPLRPGRLAITAGLGAVTFLGSFWVIWRVAFEPWPKIAGSSDDGSNDAANDTPAAAVEADTSRAK